MSFNFKKLDIPDVILIEPRIFRDERGFFMESYKSSEFKKFGIEDNFIQTNQSRSKKGVLRGLHFQRDPQVQAKLVQVISGEIFDVAVDIRKNSPYYGKWISKILSDENKNMLYIPAGFAHGFCVLSDEADVVYSCDKEYAPETESGIIWNDPDLNINWPLSDVIVSEKDQKLRNFKEIDIGVKYV